MAKKNCHAFQQKPRHIHATEKNIHSREEGKEKKRKDKQPNKKPHKKCPHKNRQAFHQSPVWQIRATKTKEKVNKKPQKCQKEFRSIQKKP
jgi:hypothetical protein